MSFKYVNEDGIDIELKCPICYDPLQSPMNCDLCGSTYCKKCISHWLKERLACPLCQQSGNQFSPVICLVVINQLKRLLVQCELCKQENLQQDSFQNHLNCDCPNYIIHCPDGCSWQGKRHQLDEHSYSCPKKIISYKNQCGCQDKREELSIHLYSRRRRTIYCPNGCNWRNRRQNLEDHKYFCWKNMFSIRWCCFWLFLSILLYWYY